MGWPAFSRPSSTTTSQQGTRLAGYFLVPVNSAGSLTAASSWSSRIQAGPRVLAVGRGQPPVATRVGVSPFVSCLGVVVPSSVFALLSLSLSSGSPPSSMFDRFRAFLTSRQSHVSFHLSCLLDGIFCLCGVGAAPPSPCGYAPALFCPRSPWKGRCV